jgi:hypothetical protein
MKEGEMNGTHSTHSEMRNADIILVAKHMRMRLLGRPSFYGRIILKLILEKKD